MRILLQQKETGLYFKEVGGWAHNPADAMDFVNSTKAIDFCATHKITGVQLVLKFEEQLYEIVMPMVTGRHFRAERYSPSP